jgi:hypothetical protein
MPPSEYLHIIQDFLANSAALGLGRDIVVTSAYRDPEDSKAHANGAIDVRCSKDGDDRFKEAQRISNGLRDAGVRGVVIVEEALPGGYQVNTYFKGGFVSTVLAGPRNSDPQLHARGTHIHVQLEPGEEVPSRYPVAIRDDGDPNSELHTVDGQSYKGPLKATKPHGNGVVVGPDGSTF